jgi:arylsulfatase A-like enzyme
MGVYGYAQDTTPNLDAWARRSSVFTNAHAPANNTLESHLSIFTSTHPLVHGIREIDHFDGKREHRPLDPRHVTLAERLKDAGYRTSAFVYACYWMDAEFGFDQGFDAYRVVEKDAASMNEELVFPWLEQQGDRPFFLFVHYYDIHSDWQRLPYDAPEAFRQKFADRCPADFTGCAGGACATERLMQLEAAGRAPDATDACVAALYDAGVAYTEQQAAKLVSKLEGLGLEDDTLVVVLADHGEEFREHGKFLHSQLYQEQLRVPLIVGHPRLFPEAQRIDAPVQTLDVMPTLLDLLGLPAVPEAQGRSLLPLLRGEAPPAEAVFSSDWWGHALREGDWKLIDDRWRKQRELYDLRADPAERRDLLQQEPERAAQLQARLDAWVEANKRQRERNAQSQGEALPPRVPDAATQERLRSLGYVD